MSASELRPLAIHALQDGDLDAIKAAKTSFDLPYRVVPCVAVPGSPSRVLALRVPPPFLCDYALVADPSNPNSVRAALYWVLHPEHVDPRASLVLNQLQAVFGPDVKEVPDDDLRPESDD